MPSAPAPRRTRGRRRRVRGDDRGATALEFALVAPIAILVIATLTTFALHMTYSALADHTARVGLQKGVLRMSTGYATEAEVKASIESVFAGNVLGNPDTVQLVRQDAVPGQGDTVRVRVTYTVAPVDAAAGLAPPGPLRDVLRQLATITRTAEGRAE